MAQTAPEGYSSNYAALLDLIRYGFGIWSPSQMAVLLFHAERSTALGRDSDQHSESQATDGIFSPRSLQWIRGPAGVSSTTWHRLNAELAINPTHTPEQNAGKVLHRTRRKNRHGKDDPTEFAIDWRQLSARIARWKLEARESQFGTLSLPSQDPQSPKLGDTQIAGQSTRIRESQFGTHSQSDFDSHRSVVHSAAASAIAVAIEQASGERPRTDRLIQTIAETGERLNLPVPAIVRWIHDKSQDLRAGGRMTSAGVLGVCAGDMIPWMKEPANRNFIEQAQREARLNAAQAATPPEVGQMPAEPDPAFARDLITEVTRRKGAKTG